jgi:hypothetical protein
VNSSSHSSDQSRFRKPQGPIYLEFQIVGDYQRVCAVDGGSGEEVVIITPARTSRADCEALAVRKLQRKLDKLKSR